ncbi:unnamed protein product [Brachionus calyciflorus]|uniref:Uncharacterized protein n=1 Tax=Brachionus calyciflorus TaxID=104777 RepID=A0A814QWV1_9BILA|nr:unnamed protein product [Brachionus calyciflorus]
MLNRRFQSILYFSIISLSIYIFLYNQSKHSISKNYTKQADVKPSVFCLIKTHPNNIKINKSLIVYKIWAHKCDNYRFITLIPNNLEPIKKKDVLEVYDQFYMIQPSFMQAESHGNLTLKMYYSMLYVYRSFPSYDWYYISDDDAYVNIKNLKTFLKDKPKYESITYGYNFKIIVKDGYHSGGPGYVLSNGAFMTICKKMDKNINNCPNSGIDDVDISQCIRNYNGKMGQSRDELGRERFLPMGLMDTFTGRNTDWLKGYGEHPPQKGLNCCSDSLIGVHYMNSRDAFRLDLSIETQRNNLKLYDEMFGLSKPITFKNILKNYLLLQDLESDTNDFNFTGNF